MTRRPASTGSAACVVDESTKTSDHRLISWSRVGARLRGAMASTNRKQCTNKRHCELPRIPRACLRRCRSSASSISRSISSAKATRCFPHFRIHADGSKPGNGVDLVDIEFAGGALQQKIDARHPFAIDGLIAGDGEALHLCGLLGRQIGAGNRSSWRVQKIFVFVIVKFARRKDLARDGGQRDFRCPARSIRTRVP